MVSGERKERGEREMSKGERSQKSNSRDITQKTYAEERFEKTKK